MILIDPSVSSSLEALRLQLRGEVNFLGPGIELVLGLTLPNRRVKKSYNRGQEAFAFWEFPLPAGGRALWEEPRASTGHVKRIGVSLPNSVSAPNWTTR